MQYTSDTFFVYDIYMYIARFKMHSVVMVVMWRCPYGTPFSYHWYIAGNHKDGWLGTGVYCWWYVAAVMKFVGRDIICKPSKGNELMHVCQ